MSLLPLGGRCLEGYQRRLIIGDRLFMTGVDGWMDGWMNYGLRELMIGYEYKWIIRSRNIFIPRSPRYLERVSLKNE